jgi:hypothetical protein
MITQSTQSGIRVRAVVVGVLLSGVIAVGLPFGEFVLNGTQMGLNSSTPAAFFLLFLLVALVQPILGAARPGWSFTPSELLSMAVMMMITTAIAGRGFVSIAIPIISGVHYFATPENDWADFLVPHVPTWMTPQSSSAIKGFYEGLSEGEPIPWGPWIEPLSWWFVFMIAFYTVVVCLMVIMRRQWMDHERLLYPLTQLPLSMVQDGGSSTGPFLKQPGIWVGAAVPCILHGINGLSHYYEFIGKLEPSHSFSLIPNLVTLHLRFDCMWTGLAYLVNTSVTFSLWFFFLLAKLETAFFVRIGVSNSEGLDIFSHTSHTGILSHQVMGGMVVMVVLGLWTARGHLWDVVQHLWRSESRSDGDELISYRMAVIGVLSGAAVMGSWLWASGLSLWAVCLFLLGAFIIFFALTRVIVEAGLAAAVQGMSGCGLLVSSVGSTALGVKGLVALGMTLAWAGDLLVFMMAPCANGIRMLHGLGRYRRRILLMMMLAMAIGLVGGVGTIIALSYEYGANNYHGQWAWFAREPFRFAANLAHNPTGPNLDGWLWNGVGAVVMTGLIWARHNLLWWPLHPIGFVAGGTWILNSIWFSIFLAWLVKVLVLHYMGANGYRATRWFFLGMILGQFVAGGVWTVVDGLTGMTGNRIRMY